MQAASWPLPSAKHDRIAAIDGLRAWAVVAVVLFHFHAPMLPGGYLGVDVFFVISGYVVTRSLARTPLPGLLPFLRDFYFRRVLRIYPALLACLLLSFLAAAMFIPASWLSTTSWRTGLLAFVGASNFALLQATDGYFAPRSDFNIFTHTWSLGVEEQFYLIFPVLLYAALRRAAPDRAGRTGLIAALALASLICCAVWTKRQPDAAFYMLAPRFWELASGALLALAHRAPGPTSPASARRWLGPLGLSLLALGFIWDAAPGHFPFPVALLAVLGTLFCVEGARALAPARAQPAWALSLHGVLPQHLGRISYSLYLWHWPVLVLMRWTVGAEGWAMMVVGLAIAMLLAEISHRCFERPTAVWAGRFQALKGPALLGALAVISASMGLSLLAVEARPLLSLSRVTKEAKDWYPAQSHPEAPATVSRPWAGRRLFVLGDSHVYAYGTLFGRLQQETGMTVVKYWTAGCALVKISEPAPAQCPSFFDQALARIAEQAGPNDVIFLPGLRAIRLSDQNVAYSFTSVMAKSQSESSRVARRQAVLDARQELEPLLKLGIPIVLELPKPVLPAPAFRCVDAFNAHNPDCRSGLSIDRAKLELMNAPVSGALQAVAADAGSLVKLWGAFDVLCPAAACAALDPSGRPLFFDGDHLSAFGNEQVYPSFLAMLQTLSH